jgi:hypothetical protein
LRVAISVGQEQMRAKMKAGREEIKSAINPSQEGMKATISVIQSIQIGLKKSSAKKWRFSMRN